MDKEVVAAVADIIKETKRLGMGGSALAVLSPFLEKRMWALVMVARARKE